jgi:hypothetical protein
MCFYTPLRAKEMRDMAHPLDKKEGRDERPS